MHETHYEYTHAHIHGAVEPNMQRFTIKLQIDQLYLWVWGHH